MSYFPNLISLFKFYPYLLIVLIKDGFKRSSGSRDTIDLKLNQIDELL